MVLCTAQHCVVIFIAIHSNIFNRVLYFTELHCNYPYLNVINLSIFTVLYLSVLNSTVLNYAILNCMPVTLVYGSLHCTAMFGKYVLQSSSHLQWSKCALIYIRFSKVVCITVFNMQYSFQYVRQFAVCNTFYIVYNSLQGAIQRAVRDTV